MKRIRSATGVYNHWDDHEFINDFSIPENGRGLYDRGVRAFRDYMPVTYSDERGIYRSFRWGKNLEIFFLDERSFRSAKASANHTCDNPDTGQPDLAPTAPQSTRNFFSALVPSLSQPVSQACKDAINSLNHTFLGGAQLNRFLDAVKSSTANWKVVMNETPIQQFYALPYDRWEGYATERVRLLPSTAERQRQQPRLPDHGYPCGARQRDPLPDPAGRRRALQRSATRPRQTPPTGTSSSARSRRRRSGRRSTKRRAPPAAARRSRTRSSSRRRPGRRLRAAWAWRAPRAARTATPQVTVTATALRIAYKDEDGNTLLDSDGTTPCGPYVLNG